MAKVARKPTAYALVAKDLTIGAPEFGRPALGQTIPYEHLPELIRLQVDACLKFGINTVTGACPKHETLVEHFVQQRTSDGRLVSPDLAKKLATCCRPADARKGGNKKR
jgi:hypothetical protein